MPSPCYDYQCTSCGKTWEERRPYEHRDAVVACPSPFCKGESKRIWTGRAPGIAFKGPGWTGVERFYQEQMQIKERVDRDWRAYHDENWYKGMEKAINTSKPVSDAEAARADRAAFEFKRTGATSGSY